MCQLEVADEGIGLPRHIDPTSAASLGFRLIRLLARRLRATIRLDTGVGTAFVIRFPLADPWPGRLRAIVQLDNPG